MDTRFALKAYGLSEKEIALYLELLPLGTVSLQEIAKRLEFPRSTVYHTLNYLIEKGLVAKIVKQKVTYYTATDPDKLQDQLIEKQKLIQEVLPELHELKKTKKEPLSRLN